MRQADGHIAIGTRPSSLKLTALPTTQSPKDTPSFIMTELVQDNQLSESHSCLARVSTMLILDQAFRVQPSAQRSCRGPQSASQISTRWTVHRGCRCPRITGGTRFFFRVLHHRHLSRQRAYTHGRCNLHRPRLCSNSFRAILRGL